MIDIEDAVVAFGAIGDYQIPSELEDAIAEYNEWSELNTGINEGK